MYMRSQGGHNQGLPARSSVKTVHRTVFRALRTPNRDPPTPLPLGPSPGPTGPFFGENCPLDSFPGPQNPAPRMSLLRISLKGA